MDLLNLRPRTTDFDEEETKSRPISRIHLRLQQRGGKKTLTLVEGLAEDLDLKKIARAIRKTFQTSAAVIKGKEAGEEVIQVNGDFREKLKDFFLRYKISEDPDPPILIHGF